MGQVKMFFSTVGVNSRKEEKNSVWGAGREGRTNFDGHFHPKTTPAFLTEENGKMQWGGTFKRSLARI